MSAQPTFEQHEPQDFNRDAEQGLLTCILRDNSSYFKVIGLIRAADFNFHFHRQMFAAIAKLLSKNTPADMLTVAEELEGDLTFTEVAASFSSHGAPANAIAYARIIAEHSQKRQMRLTLQNALATLDDQPVDQSVTAAMTSLQNLAQSGTEDTSFTKAVDMALEDAETAMARRSSGEVLGCSTTFPTLDRLTGGLHGPKMIVLGGRPGTYKSAIAWQILMRAAAEGVPVGMISLEMGASELASRAVAHELKINGHDFVSGWHVAVTQARERMYPGMKGWPIRIDDKSTRLGQIVARIIEWKYRYDIQIACVDHIQLVHHEKAQNRFQELGEVSRQMKLLAMRLNIPILVLSQLSRDVEKDHRRPVMSDMRECGNIEQDADIILFTHCDKGKGIEADRYELILSKQRGGAARQVIDIVVNGEHFFVGESA